MNAYHDGDTKYRVHFLLHKRAWVVTSETFVPGNSKALMHSETVFSNELDDRGTEDEALGYGILKLRPRIERTLRDLRGESVLPPDPVIDRAVENEIKLRELRERLLREEQEEREAAARFLDEENPLWGAFG